MISLQRVNMELRAKRVITVPSTDDDEDDSLTNEYFKSVSKQIFENCSRNRRAESMSKMSPRRAFREGILRRDLPMKLSVAQE